MDNLKEVAKHFNKKSGEWKNKLVGKYHYWTYLANVKYIIKLLDLKQEDDFLDCGHGTGTYALLASKMNINTVGIDISREMHEIAQKRINKHGNPKKAKLIICDAQKTPFKDNRFNKIVSIYVPEATNINNLLNETKRILKPNGVVVFLLCNPFSPAGFISFLMTIFLKNYKWRKMRNPFTFKKFLRKKGFTVEKVVSFNLFHRSPVPWKIKYELTKFNLKFLNFFNKIPFKYLAFAVAIKAKKK